MVNKFDFTINNTFKFTRPVDPTIVYHATVTYNECIVVWSANPRYEAGERRYSLEDMRSYVQMGLWLLY